MMLKTVNDENKNSVGVIVGRFQTDNLTRGHIDLIQSVFQKHLKTIIVIGLSQIRCTKSNPLDFESRRIMLVEKFPNIVVKYLNDNPDDHVWSNNLDKIIQDCIPPSAPVFLYGSRDSFIKYYDGKFQTVELIPETISSATNRRTSIGFLTGNSEEFRRGVIYATQMRYPTAFCAVDAIIYNETGMILLGKKNIDGGKYRTIGGFCDPIIGTTNFLEENIIREIHEECGQIEISPPAYISSQLVDDWRYRHEEDKIFSVLFSTKYLFGGPQPGDDIDELKWFHEDDLRKNYKELVIETHWILIKRYFDSLIKA